MPIKFRQHVTLERLEEAVAGNARSFGAARTKFIANLSQDNNPAYVMEWSEGFIQEVEKYKIFSTIGAALEAFKKEPVEGEKRWANTLDDIAGWAFDRAQNIARSSQRSTSQVANVCHSYEVEHWLRFVQDYVEVV